MGVIINFIVSLIVSIVTAGYFIWRQRGFYSYTMKNLDIYRNFFKKTGRYETIDVYQEDDDNIKSTKHLKDVSDNQELSGLIKDINEYLESCRGTATFGIIQNKTERRITKLYDRASSKSNFPTHYGLMGTFVGVFMGLLAFLIVSLIEGEVSDSAIHSLIMGVLVSMSTSFIGLRWSTKANNLISDARNKIDDDKNEFYEYIQNKLMPSVDISLTEALGNLHETVSNFQPAFAGVIDGFKTTFKQCTDAFGDDFRESVTTMVTAVGTMSSNVNTITQNVTLLKQLLNRLSGAEWTQYMRQFANASDHFKELTESLNDFERARRMMLAATQEAINIQKTYNDSLVIPRDVATSINGILQRVVKFEESINALGVDIAQTQMIGNTTIEEIQGQIKAIKQKHKIAEKFVDTGNERLEKFFEEEVKKLGKLQNKYFEALDNLFNHYAELITKHENEINQRHQIFIEAIDEKFELSEVRSDLGNLKRIPAIANKVEEVKTGQEKLQRASQGIRQKLEDLKSDDIGNKDKNDKNKKDKKNKDKDKDKDVKDNKKEEDEKKVDDLVKKVMDDVDKEKEKEKGNKSGKDENDNSSDNNTPIENKNKKDDDIDKDHPWWKFW